MTWKACQEASWPESSLIFCCSSASVFAVIAHRVCGITRTRSTLSRCTPRTSASSAASVTRPPGLRKILASPGLSPSIRRGSIRESMQVTIAMPAWATPSNPERLKSSANSRFAASRSSKSFTTRRLVQRGSANDPGLVPGDRLRLLAAGLGPVAGLGGTHRHPPAATVAVPDPPGVDLGTHVEVVQAEDVLVPADVLLGDLRAGGPR